MNPIRRCATLALSLFLMLSAMSVSATAQDAAAPGSAVWTDVSGLSMEAKCALRSDGAVYCWGVMAWNDSLERTPDNRGVRPQCRFYYCHLTPARVPITTKVARIDGLCEFNGTPIPQCYGCAFNADETGTCFGNKKMMPAATPKPNQPKAIVRSILTEHDCIIADAGAAYCRGHSHYGQLGIGKDPEKGAKECLERTLPSDDCYADYVRVATSESLSDITVGEAFTCALGTSGKAWCWGRANNGRLGNGDTKGRNEPAPVAGDRQFTAIAAGKSHACAVTKDGEAFCWGAGKEGQLGTGAMVDQNVPTLVAGGNKFASVFSSASTTCALTADGSAWCWGAGKKGQMGDGQTVEKNPSPVAVAGEFKFQKLFLFGDHACGIGKGGAAIYCWGDGELGQLGHGAAADRVRPDRVVLP